jgi:hypothetical protein
MALSSNNKIAKKINRIRTMCIYGNFSDQLSESVYTIPLPWLWCSCCLVSLYTLPLYWVWCSCCSVSLSVHTTPPLGLVFILLCESVCTHYPSPVNLPVHNTPPLGLVFMLLSLLVSM